MKLYMSVFVSLVIILVIATTGSCKKEKPNPNTTNTDSVQIYTNVHIIDSAAMPLNTSATLINSGTYQYTTVGAAPVINAGDILVGATGDGYIRKVVSVSTSGNTITVQTTQGRMTDVFKTGSFNFNMDMNNMSYGKTQDFTYSITNHAVYQNGPLSITLNNGQIALNPTWLFGFGFTGSGINYFEMSTQNSTLNSTFLATVTAAQAITLANKIDTLTKYTKSYTQWVQAGAVAVPVVVRLNFFLLMQYSVAVSTHVSSTSTFISNSTFNLGAKYIGGAWQGIYSLTPTNVLNIDTPSGGANVAVSLALIPEVSAMFYGVSGPYASVGLQEQLTGKVASPQTDWNFGAAAWLQTTAGADATILSYALPNYNTNWNTTQVTYSSPYQIAKVSGDNQSGTSGQALLNPVKVLVTDTLNRPQVNVPVYFNVTNGGGSVTPANVMTDAHGNAQATWTLGNGATQQLTATAKKGDESNIKSAPLTFNATTSSACPATAIDIDGNVYNVVRIGTQCWLQENLKTAHFANGDAIREVEDSTTWTNLYYTAPGGPAWCYPNADAANNTTYGKLYNFYATNDPRGVCPTGFHVPSDTDFERLSVGLGGDAVSGGHLKSINLWLAPNTGADNSSGFTALPAGYRAGAGHFIIMDYAAGFWTSTPVSVNVNGYYIYLSSQSVTTEISNDNGLDAFSVRCVGN